MRGVLRVALTVALAAGCSGYFLAEKHVTVAVGGRVREAKTFAPTVGAALARLGVEVGPADRVIPSFSTELDQMHTIEVRRAKDVVVVLNGQPSAKTVTGETVEQVLEELSIDGEGALLLPEAPASVASGDEIIVSQPAEVTVVYDDQVREVITNEMSAEAVLRDLEIALGPHDRVEPGLDAYPSAGSVIKVVRVNEAVETIESDIAFETTTEESDEVELGMTKVKTKGAKGVRARTYQITYENGKETARVLLKSEVVKEPVAQVTLVGSKKPAPSSTGNSQTGKASWFEAPGLTAAHKSLPFGTVVKVTNLANGRTTTAVVRDRGPYTDGRVIDLSDAAFKEISTLGRGVIDVRVEW